MGHCPNMKLTSLHKISDDSVRIIKKSQCKLPFPNNAPEKTVTPANVIDSTIHITNQHPAKENIYLSQGSAVLGNTISK